MEIILKYSLVWILPVIILSALLSYLLYSSKKKADISLSARILLGVIRFFTFSFLGLLLLSPLLKSYVLEVKKPVFIMLVDNSQSMVSGKDSTQKRNDLLSFTNSIEEELKNKYDIFEYSFGSHISLNSEFSFDESASNLSSALKSIQKMNRHRNVGGAIIISDGIINMGENPIYAAENSPYPIYTYGFGDTTRGIDLSISRLLSNEIAFSGDKMPIIIDVKAVKSKGLSSKLELFIDNEKIEERQINWSSDYQISNFNFSVIANKSGIRKITVRVSKAAGEINDVNNSASFFVEVIDARQKILIAYEAPHPDIAALTKSIKLSDNFLIDQSPIASMPDLNNYNLVILYGLPSSNRDFLALKNKLVSSKIPYFLILNSNVNLNTFNSLGTGIQIIARNQSINEVKPVLNSNFVGFKILSDLPRILPNLSPLSSPFGEFKISDNINVVLNQKIGSVTTDYPLLAMNNVNDVNNAVLLGEGIWRWWMIAFQENGNTKAIDDFFLNIIRTTSLKVKKERFKIQCQNIYSGDEPIQLRALVYNSSFQPIVSPDVNILITNTDNETSFSYSFSKTDEAYILDLGILPSGNYNYSSTVKIGEEEFTKKGNFVVQHLNRELLNLEANHGLLKQIANLSGGKYYDSLIPDSLASNLSNREDLVNIENKFLKYSDIIDVKLLLALLIFFISIEWFARKFLGIY